ncbi:hypothetical protein Poli38472_008405 [Pythium oligandrum]|uniref:Uncharacterized protein n=1 Tax=Pythium oligandrum TaxID=41045 RepID=A0A8K1CMS4_PYTOL|nr:hypothetical protein Poli38472_008405 [Pythium oligandrum]|eukprot:TMW65763.1 hypothetical protein Poli38472_008405 [Pythium oligandrum]
MGVFPLLIPSVEVNMASDEDVEWEDFADETEREAATGGDEEEDEEFVYSPGEEDDEEVDWEAVEGDDKSVSNATADKCLDSNSDEEDDEASAEAAVKDLNAVNWDHINNVLQREAEKANKKPKKRKVVRMSKDDKQHEVALHKSHLLVSLAMQQQWNRLCQVSVLRGLMLSLTSESDVDFYRDLDTMPRKYALELLVRWFNGVFRTRDVSRAGEDDAEDENEHMVTALLTESRLMRVFYSRRGHDYELAVLFTLLCRAVGLRTRHCAALDPLVVQQHTMAFESSAVASTPTSRKRARCSAGARKAEEPMETSSGQQFWAWSEVLDEKNQSWVMVDAVRKVVDRPQEIQTARGKSRPLSYVVSINAEGILTDVSSRYVDRWSKTLPLRLADDWFTHSLSLVNASIDDKCVWRDPEARAVELRLQDKERDELTSLKQSEEMPNSLEGFKKHHVYCLERHLGRYECIYPRKAVGIFKGQAVYPRKSVQTVRTMFQWRQLGREIKAEEQQKPAKREGKPSKGGGDSDDDGISPGGSGAVGRALYGFWQTDEVTVAAVENGVVPKNKYGNIEVWSPAHLPRGSVHLRLSRIERVASQLGVDFAPAVVGFEVKNGKNYPKIEGIVVAATVEAMLVDAHAHIQQSTIEQAIEKNQQAILKRWERLVKRLLLKQRLNDEYGEV